MLTRTETLVVIGFLSAVITMALLQEWQANQWSLGDLAEHLSE